MFYSTSYLGSVRVGDVVFSVKLGPGSVEGVYQHGELDLEFVPSLKAGSFIYPLGGLVRVIRGGVEYQFRKVLMPVLSQAQVALVRALPYWRLFERKICYFTKEPASLRLEQAISRLLYSPSDGALILGNVNSAWNLVISAAGPSIVAHLRERRNEAYRRLKLDVEGGVLYSTISPIPAVCCPLYNYKILTTGLHAVEAVLGRREFSVA